jgi:2-polyprenyl-3-methyl-5-hydroxy-6-metoxy-1,4-benzoquinol methylase
MPVQSPDFPEFDGVTAAVWDSIADWFGDRNGDGNVTQDLLVEPAQERLLGLDPDDQLLEIGCGAGRFARHMAATGVRVTAFDQSEVFINRAQERTSQHADRITYDVLNATGPCEA